MNVCRETVDTKQTQMLYLRNIERGMTPEELTSVFYKFAMPDPYQGSGISAFAYLRVEEVRIFETDAFALVELSEVHETIEEIIEELNIYCNSNGLNVKVQKSTSKLKFLLKRRAASAIKKYCGSESLNDIAEKKHLPDKCTTTTTSASLDVGSTYQIVSF